ncbi:MAG: DUF2970 domain-containing protein [Pseudomonadota bacterium]
MSEVNTGTDIKPDSRTESEMPEEAVSEKDLATQPPAGRLGLLQVIGSVLAAGLGVQSSRNRERDFQQGRAGVFIVAGFIFTALFIGGVYTVVSVVLASR